MGLFRVPLPIHLPHFRFLRLLHLLNRVPTESFQLCRSDLPFGRQHLCLRYFPNPTRNSPLALFKFLVRRISPGHAQLSQIIQAKRRHLHFARVRRSRYHRFVPRETQSVRFGQEKSRKDPQGVVGGGRGYRQSGRSQRLVWMERYASIPFPSLTSGHSNLFALTVLPTSGSLTPVTNAFTPLPPTASPRLKSTLSLKCPTMTSVAQFTGILSQVTGDFGMEHKEILRREDAAGSTGECGERNSLGYAH